MKRQEKYFKFHFFNSFNIQLEERFNQLPAAAKNSWNQSLLINHYFTRNLQYKQCI